MSTTVTYKGNTIATLTNQTKTLTTEGTWLDANIVVTDTTSSSATQHNIYFEFSDNTNTTIPIYYDDSLIGTMITSYPIDTYNNKTVNLAQLDNITWYTRATEVWVTVYEESDKACISDTPYNYFWLDENNLGDIYPTNGSVWKITINNTEYQCTAYLDSNNNIRIGNLKYSGGTDDGSGVPFCFYNAGWGAWVGDTELPVVGYHIKVEQLTNV